MAERDKQNWQVGTVVRLKKQHPCGSFDWEITRAGLDFRLRCLGCGRYVLLDRQEFQRRLKG